MSDREQHSLHNAFCVLVDWGTTSFRLWVVDQAGAVLAESRGREGMQHAAEAGFGAVLDRHLQQAGASASLPVVICGMAGARQGWVEAAYLATPTRLDTVAASATILTERSADTRILPGLSHGDPAMPGVMRGEETQLMGLALADESALVCMPGTHCKWVEIIDGAVTSFSTFMTGELFDVLASHSILKHAVGEGAAGKVRPDAHFLSAVKTGFDNPDIAWARIFALRAAQLLNLSDPADGAGVLSGLLIGAEIGAALKISPAPERVIPERLILVASGQLADLYSAALRHVGLQPELQDAEAATRKGLLAAAHIIMEKTGGR